jgi:hypothetical protein
MTDPPIAASDLAARAETPLLSVRGIATIAGLAIALGFVMQGLILAAKLASGGSLPGAQLLLDVVQGVTWSFLVCLGLGIGTAIAKARPLLPGVMGLVCAPLAIGAAKASQQVVASLLDTVGQPAALSLAATAGLKSVEYGVLGWLLGLLAQKQVVRLTPYLLSGSVIGLVFGGGIAALSHHVALAKGLDPTLPQIVGSVVNEVVFPIGCSLVIYVGQLIGRRIK